MAVSTADVRHPADLRVSGWYASLNARWHEVALQGFMAIVLFHWLEHIIQAYQLWGMGWSRPRSMGLLGMYYPWLMRTEVLHYGFAIVMVTVLWVLRKGFTGTSYRWWMASFWLQFWHHFEHLILFYQAQTQQFWFGGSVPTSIGQIWVPRIELHLIYNAVVFVPMLVAMYYHLYPPAREESNTVCTCARRRPPLTVAA